MTAIANVATTNTFDYWRLRTNEIISFVNTGAANTGATVANTTFQSALANTNLSVSDRLQVANAAALYSTLTQLGNTNSYIATKVNTTTFNSALANTNSYIATNLANTNLAVSDRLQVANGAILASNNDFTSTNQMRLGAPVKTTTANTYTLAIADAGFYHRLAYANTAASGSTTVGITVPANATEAIPIGSEYLFVRTGSNSAFQFANAAGVVLNSDGGKLRVRYQWQSAVCKKIDTDEWDVIGNLAT